MRDFGHRNKETAVKAHPEIQDGKEGWVWVFYRRGVRADTGGKLWPTEVDALADGLRRHNKDVRDYLAKGATKERAERKLYQVRRLNRYRIAALAATLSEAPFKTAKAISTEMRYRADMLWERDPRHEMVKGRRPGTHWLSKTDEEFVENLLEPLMLLALVEQDEERGYYGTPKLTRWLNRNFEKWEFDPSVPLPEAIVVYERLLAQAGEASSSPASASGEE